MKKTVLYLKLMLVSIIIAACILLIFFIYINSSKFQDIIIDIQSENIHQSVYGYLEHKEDESTTLSHMFFKQKGLIESLKNKNRQKFYDDILPLYTEYKNVDQSLWGVHIILSNGHSFIRVHSPNTEDRYINSKKALIKKTITTQTVQSGFEIGKFGYFFRVIYPIVGDDGEFLAVAELSYKVDALMEDIKKHSKHDFAFLFQDDEKNRDLIDYSNKTNDGFIIQYITSDFMNTQLHKLDISDLENLTIASNEKYYELSTFNLGDFQNGAKIIIMNNITDLVLERKKIFKMLIMILTLVSTVVIALVIFLISFFQKRIEEEERETLVKKEELYFKSRHNNITSLPNMNIATEDIELFKEYSIIMLNIDNLSIFNTTYGLDITDLLINECATNLKHTIPNNGKLYHINGGEFIIILNTPTSNQEIMLASQIKAYFEHTPVIINNIHSIISFSFGIAVHSENSKLDLYSKANIALVEAKHRGSGLVLMYNETMSDYGSYTQLAKNIAILQKDLEAENLIPFYQPIVDTFSKETIKYEVLARIKDGGKFLPPAQFLDAAKISGLESAVTKQIIQKSFQYFESTSTAFSINITKHDLLEKYLIEFLDIKIKKHNIDPKNVTLEMLEDIVVEDDITVINQINQLSDLGFVIAIDDFGVENSNMSRITDLKIDFIKIDGSFIKDLDSNEKHFKIVESLVYMGEKLGVKIIAEFVHDENIYNIVKNLGIHYCQGYYFSEPKEFVIN
ncbi:MAG: EAL domain-containing protein [Campylobacterota bacterium]